MQDEHKMDKQCEWCRNACTQMRPRCDMMAGYAEAQLRERLAYACIGCSAYLTLNDRIVALVVESRQGSGNPGKDTL